MKKVLSLILCILCMITLASCATDSENVEAFVKGNLDSVLKNIHSEEYMTFTGEDISSLGESFGNAVSSEAEYFLAYTGCEGSSQDIRNKAEEMIRNIFSGASYDITQVNENDNGYSVTVNVRPITNIADAVSTDTETLMKLLEDRYGNELYKATDSERTDMCAEVVIENADSGNIRYADEVSVEISVTEDSDGMYVIPNEDFLKLYGNIILY